MSTQQKSGRDFWLENLNKFLEHYLITTKGRLRIQPNGLGKPGLCISPYCGSSIEGVVAQSEESIGNITNSSPDHIFFDFGDATYLIRYRK